MQVERISAKEKEDSVTHLAGLTLSLSGSEEVAVLYIVLRLTVLFVDTLANDEAEAEAVGPVRVRGAEVPHT